MYNKIDLCEVPAERLKEISLDLVNIDAQAPEFEPNRQFYFMAKARDYVKRKSAELGRPMTFFTQTFGCPMKKEPSAIGMMDFPLENGRIFTIRGPLQNIWTRENMERTGQTPAEIC